MLPKLYGKVSAVIAEIIANSYDADATKVTVTSSRRRPFRVSRHNHRSSYQSISLEVPDDESLGVKQRSRVLGGCAPALARNHVDQPFGGGLGDHPRAIIPSSYERELVESLSIQSTAATSADRTTAWLRAARQSNSC